MLPLLFLAQVGALVFAVRHAMVAGAVTARAMTVASGLVAALTLWGVASGWLAHEGLYRTPSFLAAWPAVWITMVPVVLVMAPLAAAPVRDGLRALLDTTPAHWIVALHGLRILAIGGILKGLSGEFALYYALLIGVPDMLYGLSALWVARRAARQRIAPRALALWHLAGATIIVPFGVVLLQMGLPGPWRIFAGTPDIATIFVFPMALAPTLVVPLFVCVNLLAALRIAEREAVRTIASAASR